MSYRMVYASTRDVNAEDGPVATFALVRSPDGFLLWWTNDGRVLTQWGGSVEGLLTRKRVTTVDVPLPDDWDSHTASEFIPKYLLPEVTTT